MLCPRCCGVNRLKGQLGHCGSDARLRVARAALHHWEEPPISGWRGSGTIFFVGCPLHCVYCQNIQISASDFGSQKSTAVVSETNLHMVAHCDDLDSQVALTACGSPSSKATTATSSSPNLQGTMLTHESHDAHVISEQQLANIFLNLEKQGAHNINLVTPTHYLYSIIAAIKLARLEGFNLPIVYNTSGYERPESIALLTNFVDVFLTDFKYASAALAKRYSCASDYPEVAFAALQAMYAQTGACTFNSDGIMTKGIIVRHLMLPGQLQDSKAVIKKVFQEFDNNVCLSLMNQYTPMPQFLQKNRFPELCRTVSEYEYDELIEYALDLGVSNSFMQEEGTVDASFVPAFDGTGVY
ncbi:MAG: radical SAM protein [Coriobacteriales bacterium]|nr:radical SAM protein [Coriobacteriales bacterium]